MLKTNSKQVKEKIQDWLIEITREALMGQERQDVSQIEIQRQPITTADRIFQKEKDWEIKHYGRQQAFNDWQTGLNGTIPAYKLVLYGEALKNKIMEWLEETEAEANKYDEEANEKLFLWLVYREFEALLAKEKKQSKKQDKDNK